MKASRLLAIAFALNCFFIPEISRASHAAGAELTYIHLSGNTYRFIYILYRDCDGIPVLSSIPLSVSNSCGFSYPIITVTQDSFAELNRGCAQFETRCTNPSGYLMGIQAYYYHADVTLPGTCNEWVFGYAECCRSSALQNLSTPSSWNLYVETTLNNSFVPSNNSARFSELPEVFLCYDTVQHYYNNAWDPDGDSLVFELSCPLSNQGIPVIPAPPYTCTQPVSFSSPADSTICNSATGEVVFHADAVQMVAVMMLVKEFRNGQMIGSVVERDMNVIFKNCGSGSLPGASGMNGDTVFTAHICIDSLFTFFIDTYADSTQPTVLIWDNGIPGGVFATSGTFRDTGYFSWQPGVQDTGYAPHEFTVTVFDGYCGNRSYIFRVFVDSCHATIGIDETTSVLESFKAAYIEPQLRFSFRLRSTEKAFITLRNYTGQVLSKTKIDPEKQSMGSIDCTGLPQGIYLLTLETVSGIQRTIKVVIINP